MMRRPPTSRKNKRLTQSLMDWYAKNRRDLPWRRTHAPYAIWVSEVMLQQTQVKTVVPYYLKFMALYPAVDDLARAELQQVLKAWEGLGYYSRARNLHRAARIVSHEMPHGIPDQWDDLRRLPGIGNYIASALLSIAFEKPFAVVDGNVKRVLSRLFTLAAPVNQSASHDAFQQQADKLLDHQRPGDYNQAIMELGALVCLPRNPSCSQCPASPFCRAAAQGVVADFPKRNKRPPVPTKDLVAAVIWKRGRLLLTQRPTQGLLGGLWELPTGIVASGQDPETACLTHIKEALGLDITLNRRLTVIKHAYTHFKIRMTVYECRWRKGRVRLKWPPAFAWITPDQVDQYALHKAMAKAWPHIVTPEDK